MSQHWVEVSDQLQAAAALPPEGFPDCRLR
jgi:hypothetical protein